MTVILTKAKYIIASEIVQKIAKKAVMQRIAMKLIQSGKRIELVQSVKVSDYQINYWYIYLSTRLIINKLQGSNRI